MTISDTGISREPKHRRVVGYGEDKHPSCGFGAFLQGFTGFSHDTLFCERRQECIFFAFIYPLELFDFFTNIKLLYPNIFSLIDNKAVMWYNDFIINCESPAIS